MERLTDQLIFDWNVQNATSTPTVDRMVRVHDETLRDGLQSPSVVDPSIEDKIRILHLLEQLGVDSIDLGFPAASRRAYEDVLRLAQEIVRHGMKIRPACAARTVESDIRPILEISQEAGIAIEVLAFLGSSPIRALVESWDEAVLVERTGQAVELAVRHGNPVTYVTEDTTRSYPSTLEALFGVALQSGAHGICLCDTVGHSTPDGVKNLVRFTRRLSEQLGVSTVIDWHGHDDRGLALSNAMAALEAGADRVHTTVLGVGERAGNTALEPLLINLKLQGMWDAELMPMRELCETVSQSTHVSIPANYPGLGRDAFRTASGIHASAIIKASTNPKHAHLADLIYSSVPAAMLGRRQEIEISHMSGASNVIFWLKQNEIPVESELVSAILNLAKSMNRVLSREEILEVVHLSHSRIEENEVSLSR